MKKYICFFIPVFFLLFSAFCFAEDNNDFLLQLKNKLTTYLKYYPEEKIYLQTDKTIYRQNETIWFNTFLLNSNTHKPSDISNVVYVELKGPGGNIIKKHELLIQEGMAKGDFELNKEKNLPGGIYTIVAYSRWMKNFGEECLFTKKITVQKVITPRILLKLDFEKKAYGPGDEVVVLLKATDIQNNSVKEGKVDTKVKINGKSISGLTNFTDIRGNVKISFHLPQDLNTTDGIVDITITDRGMEESIARSIPIVLDKIDLQFFPEGGDPVENVKTRIAFEALNEYGKGADVSGEIIDEDNKVITRFESFHQGMGVFDFLPLPGKTYHAKITKPVGNTKPFLLPSPLPTGYVFNLIFQNEKGIIVRIHAPQAGRTLLTALVHGEIYYNRQFNLQQGENRIEIPTTDFPSGIAVITLFDPENTEVCERLVFTNKDKGLQIKLETDKNVYKPGEGVDLDITTTDNNNNPIPARLSLSVVDEQLLTFADDKQDNILTSLLLSSELKGKIYEPSFYFDENEPKAADAIDYLMLTHGWRRFTWKDVEKPSRKLILSPEKSDNNVFGYITNRKGKRTQAEVFILERGPSYRVGKVLTTKEGNFAFYNVNLAEEALVVTKLPNQVHLIYEDPPVITFNSGEKSVNSIAIPDILQENIVQPVVQNRPENSESPNTYSIPDEVVITGQPALALSSIAGSYAISKEVRYEIPQVIPIESLLSGRIPGLITPTRSINPGDMLLPEFKGITSLGKGNNSPLFTLDNVYIGDPTNPNFSNLNILNFRNLETITVSKSPNNIFHYGNLGVNGVVNIETKSVQFYKEKITYKYYELPVNANKRQYYQAREFRSNPGTTYDPHKKRTDFNTTVYWNAEVKTNKSGKANISFWNNESVSSFRVTAEGISGGHIGRKELNYSSQLPISVDAKIPEFIAISDTVYIPVTVTNNTNSPVQAKLSTWHNYMINSIGITELSVEINPLQTNTVYFPVTANSEQGSCMISISAECKSYRDDIRQKVNIRSIEFPQKISFTGINPEYSRSFTIKDAEPNSIKGEVVCYMNHLDKLFSGTEAILREPHGCFEQVSSVTFPSIFALQYLKATGKIDKEAEKTAIGYLKSGYNRLKTYETNGGGFEWYGGSPGSTVLTALGYRMFYEMQKAYPDVDKKMMQRSLDFILKQRTGQGGFLQERGKYGFTAATEKINNAYIVYALTETAYTDIEPEYQHSLKEVELSRDSYRMALLANAAYNLNKPADYKEMISYFKDAVQTDFTKIAIEGSIVYSDKKTLLNETIALWIIALLKDKDTDLTLINKCIEYITLAYNHNSFGNTQASSLCLQALTKYAEKFHITAIVNGDISVKLNGLRFDYKQLTKDSDSKIVLNNFCSYLKEGKHLLQINLNGIKNLVYNVDISWNSKIPASDAECPLQLSTVLQDKLIKRNQSTRLSIKLTNTKNTGQPMSIAVIGIPGGLSLQPWQLKELQEKEVFDFYEIIDNKLVIYYRELGPNETKQIHLDLKAEVPGKYTGVASYTYLYYSDTYKYWTKGNTIEITKE